MDVGFSAAGFDVVWANDFDKDACATYRENFGGHVVCGDINEHIPALAKFADVDCLFGGPPCQGFSVAGKMDPSDERSQLVMSFMQAVDAVRPKSFVMENVKALGVLSKFELVRSELVRRARKIGYNVELLILNSKDFGVPQSRERMFLVGFKGDFPPNGLKNEMLNFKKESLTVREAIAHLGPAGSVSNAKVVKAKITIAKHPILRKSPYAGMLFNGQGRPVNPDTFSSTLHASMGGNRTPIIDEEQLYNNKKSWIEEYHQHLVSGGEPYGMREAPERLRRMTVDEAHLLQTFPAEFSFVGPQSSVFRQIGNAVPCNLARAVAHMVFSLIDGRLGVSQDAEKNYNLELVV